MGSVYKARDTRLGRMVALKVLPPGSMRDERLVKRFQLEARAAAAVTHPNVVAVYDVGEVTLPRASSFGDESIDLRFLVEELVEGVSLRKLIKQQKLGIPRLIEIATGIAQGLDAAHAKGLVHRDLKPENILVDTQGTAKIADFGLVRWIYPETSASALEGEPLSAALTRTGFVVGTLGYMSPEQAKGDPVGPASDLFVFGILMYEALTGTTPFGRPNIEESFRAILKEDPRPLLELLPEAPPFLSHIVHRCLERDLRRRYDTAAKIVRDLARLKLEMKPERTPRPAVKPERTIATSSRKREFDALLALAAAGAVVLAFFGGFFAGRVGGRPAPAESAAAPLADGFDSAESWVATPVDLPAGVGEAALSAGGERLAFVQKGEGSDGLYVLPLKAGSQPLLIGPGRSPVFTRDGRRVVFSGSGVLEASAEKVEAPVLLVDAGEEPALSLDEKRLAFVRRGRDGAELWLSGRGGEAPARLVSAPGHDLRHPVFIDAERLVVLDVAPGADAAAEVARLFVVSLANPKLVPFDDGRKLDPTNRVALHPEGLLVRTWRDRSTLLVGDRTARRAPFGAGLSTVAVSGDGRLVMTKADGGAVILWRRKGASS